MISQSIATEGLISPLISTSVAGGGYFSLSWSAEGSAITATLMKAWHHRLYYAIEHSGGSEGNQLIISNETLCVDAVNPSILKKTILTRTPTSASAIQAFLGGQPVATRIYGRGEVVNQWAVSTTPSAGLPVIIVDAKFAMASKAILVLEYLHTMLK